MESEYDELRRKLNEWCQQNKVRIEIFAGMGVGCMEIYRVELAERAVLVVENEQP